MSKRLVITTLVVIALLLAAGFVLPRFFPGVSVDLDRKEKEIDISSWQTYRSQDFGFEIKLPPDWKSEEFSEEHITQVFNFYPPEVSKEPPFIHHSDSPNVSIFPQGVPTEGVFGETVDSDVSFKESVRVANDFVLEDGTPWATFATFTNHPQSWNQSGFVWARVDIDNLDVKCLRGEEVLEQFACDPLFGDEVIRYGEVNEEEREIQKAILSSLKFL